MLNRIFQTCIIFLGFFGSSVTAEVFLNFPVGETVDYHISQDTYVLYPLSARYENNGKLDIQMGVTLLEGNETNVEVVIREFSFFDMDEDPEDLEMNAFQMEYIESNVLNRPLVFHIEEPYNVTETTGILNRAIDEDCIDLCELLESVFKYFLGSIFHLKEIALEQDQTIPVSVFDWFEEEDTIALAIPTGFYKIDHIGQDCVNATWGGDAKVLIDDIPFDLTLEGHVRWDRNNALIQQRETIIKMDGKYLVFEYGVMCKDQWASKKH